MIFFHLKNCLFPYISRQCPVRIPHRAFFPRAFRFRPKTSIFPCLFEQKSAFFTVFTACFCAFIQSSSPVRTEFPLYSVQNSRKSACHFYLCTALKPCIFPCADVAKRLPFACKEEPQANSYCFADFVCKADLPQPFKDSRCQARYSVTGSP